MSDNNMAGCDEIWVCACCGKTAQDRYGIDGPHDSGWDESCMLNALLCRYPKTGLQWEPVRTDIKRTRT